MLCQSSPLHVQQVLRICFEMIFTKVQQARKVLSDSSRLVDFVIGQVSSVFNWSNGRLLHIILLFSH